MKRRLLCALSLPLLATGCGFEPLYYTPPANTQTPQEQTVQDALSATFIQTIPNQDGQYLYNRLVDRINRLGYPQNPRYILTVSSLTERHKNLDITKNDNATRAQLKLETTITLIDAQDASQILFQRSLRSISSYNILASEFATRVSEQSTKENALNELAEQITAVISLYFKKHTEN